LFATKSKAIPSALQTSGTFHVDLTGIKVILNAPFNIGSGILSNKIKTHRDKIIVTLADGIHQAISDASTQYTYTNNLKYTHGSNTPASPKRPLEISLRTAASAGDFSSTETGWYLC
jgi:hypothetical protein